MFQSLRHLGLCVPVTLSFWAGAAMAEQLEIGLGDGCPVPGEHPAGRAGEAVETTFVNQTGVGVWMVWIDYDGGLVSYGKVAPGESLFISTFADHAWLAVDDTGTCHGGLILPRPGSPRIDIR